MVQLALLKECLYHHQGLCHIMLCPRWCWQYGYPWVSAGWLLVLPQSMMFPVCGPWRVFWHSGLMSNHFFLNFGNLLSDPWVDSICHPIPRSVFSFVGNTSVQCSKQYILVCFNPSNKHFNLRVREVYFLRPLCHDSGEGKRIHSRIIKAIVTTIYGQLEVFLNAND